MVARYVNPSVSDSIMNEANLKRVSRSKSVNSMHLLWKGRKGIGATLQMKIHMYNHVFDLLKETDMEKEWTPNQNQNGRLGGLENKRPFDF